jgi:Rrf2 family cysteine metabolism transcriptional repressor
MKFSSRARYALRLMLDISTHQQEGGPVNLKAVSRRTGISNKYLEQLVMPLKAQRLLRSINGRKGGYLLARPADQIKIGDIINATTGPVILVDCLGEKDICMQAEFCECRLIYRLINQRINDVLNDYSLASLADKKKLAEIKSQVRIA